MTAPSQPTNAVVSFPEVDRPPENSLRGWAGQVVALTGRQVLVACRDVPTLIQILVFPAITMVMFKVVLGDIVGKATGQDSAFGTVPLIVLVSAMSGSMVAASRLNLERRTGLLARLWVMPINRFADVASRVAGESVRVAITTVIILAAGHLIGFRFTQGVGPAVGLFLVAVGYGSAYAMFSLALAVNAKPGPAIVQFLGLLSTGLMFFNSGFSPIEAYPGWLQPLVANQPMTPAIELMRSLAAGGPLTSDAIKVSCWVVVIALVTAVPILRGYRKAAIGR